MAATMMVEALVAICTDRNRQVDPAGNQHDGGNRDRNLGDRATPSTSYLAFHGFSSEGGSESGGAAVRVTGHGAPLMSGIEESYGR